MLSGSFHFNPLKVSHFSPGISSGSPVLVFSWISGAVDLCSLGLGFLFACSRGPCGLAHCCSPSSNSQLQVAVNYNRKPHVGFVLQSSLVSCARGRLRLPRPHFFRLETVELFEWGRFPSSKPTSRWESLPCCICAPRVCFVDSLHAPNRVT